MRSAILRALLCGNAMQLTWPESCSFCATAASMRHVKELDVKLQQQINLFFCFKLGWIHKDARAALVTVFGDQVMHVTKSRRWYREFQGGRTRLVDLERAHRHKTGRSAAKVQAVRNMIDTDKSITLAAVVTQTGFSQTSVYRIIRKDLNLRLRCAKLLPAFLTPRHIVECFNHASNMLQMVRTRPSYLKKIVTMDEAWCYQYDPELKRQASQWLAPGEPRPSHPHRTISIKKILLVAFFDCRGMVHFEYI